MRAAKQIAAAGRFDALADAAPHGRSRNSHRDGCRSAGSLAWVIAMVDNALDRGPLNHRAVRRGTLRVEDDRAAQAVIVAARPGEAVASGDMQLRQ